MLMMENIKAFFGAALPWLMMGAAIAVFAARNTAGKKKGNSPSGDYGAEGMCIGMSLGVCIGALSDNVGLGLSLGMLAGLVAGSCIRKNSGGNAK